MSRNWLTGRDSFFGSPLMALLSDISAENFMDDFGKMSDKIVKGIRSDVKETDKSYIVEAELAGYAKEDISVEMSDNVLTISAETKSESEDKNDTYVRKERHTGKSVRTYTFDEVDGDNITAKYNNGILTVEVPKAVKNVSKKKVIIE